MRLQVQHDVRIGRALRGQLAQSGWDRFVPSARVLLSQEMAERFETGTDPQGRPWQPLSPRTRRIAVQRAIRKVGGREARPQVVRRPSGELVVRARNPQQGYQRTARVRRTKRSKILVDTGRLKQSVVANAATADAVRRADRVRLLWGTRVPYARNHQYGVAPRLPARPFLGVSPQGQQRLAQLYRAALQSQIEGTP